MPELPLAALRLDGRHLARLCELLQRHLPAAEVWAYGSRITEQGHEGSDLDLAVRNPQAPEVETPGLGALRAALQESDLPLQVDLVDWARIPASFRREIAAGYVVVWRVDANTR